MSVPIPTPPPRYWFAVWRWNWWTWVALTPLLFAMYLLSPPLTYFPFHPGGLPNWPGLAILNIIHIPAVMFANCFAILYDIWRWEERVIIEIVVAAQRWLQSL